MRTEVSEFRKKKFEEAFYFMDINQKGGITRLDFVENIVNLRKELNLGEKGYLTCKRIMLSWWALLEEEAEKNGGAVGIEQFVEGQINYYGSGEVSLVDDVQGHFRTIFKFIDQNGDKVLSFEEFFAFYKAHNWTDEDHVREIFRRLDTDNDGFLSEEEFVHAKSSYWLSDDPENGFEFLYKRRV